MSQWVCSRHWENVHLHVLAKYTMISDDFFTFIPTLVVHLCWHLPQTNI